MRPGSRFKSKAFALTLAIVSCFFTGCAHYVLPANHLESPEVRGSGWGRVELASLGMASDLNVFARKPAPDPETGVQGKAQVQKAFPAYTFGFNLPIGEKFEAGVRMQPYAPLMLKAKYQLSGVPESSAGKGSFAAAGVLSAGLLLAQGSTPGETASYSLVDLALPIGYRLWERHLFSLTPFVSMASFSGIKLHAALTGAARASEMVTSASVTQVGAAIGHQYGIQALFIRSELAYLKGSLGDSELGGFYLGVLTGLNL